MCGLSTLVPPPFPHRCSDRNTRKNDGQGARGGGQSTHQSRGDQGGGGAGDPEIHVQKGEKNFSLPSATARAVITQFMLYFFRKRSCTPSRCRMRYRISQCGGAG